MSLGSSPIYTGSDLGPEERMRRVVKRIHDLPSFPLVIRKLMEVAERPNSSSRDMARVMEKDQGLSAKVLKLVNSAFYSFSRPVSSLQHAVTLLGYNSIRSLAMSVSVKGLFKGLREPFDQERFWEHSLATAIGSKLIAEKNAFPHKDDVFTAGLLHDIGILLEARYFPDELSTIIETVARGERSFLEVELELLGVHHGVMGSWLAERWRLPESLREPILRHHGVFHPELETMGTASHSEPEVERMVEIVALANVLANGMGYTTIPAPEAEPGDEAVTIAVPQPLEQIVDRCSVPELVHEMRERFEQSREFLTI